MTTVGEIAIVVGADISPMVREFDRAKGKITGLESAASKMGRGLGVSLAAAGAAAATAVVAVVALTKASMNNIDVMSKQARALGLSVSSFQAMAMVAGEAGVEAEQLSKVLVKMQDNIASLGQGSSAQVDQFNRLGVSMASLSGQGADEQFRIIAESLNNIKDPAERTAAALNVFGKSGVDVITMLDGYGAAVDNAAGFQEKLGIAVSDLDAQQIEAANDALGRLGMVAEGIGNSLAVIAAPALVAFADGLQRIAGLTPQAQASLESFFGSIETARASLGEDVFNKIVGDPEKIRASADALDDLAGVTFAANEIDAAYSSLIQFADTLRMLGQEVEANRIESLAEQLVQAQVALADNTNTAEEFRAKLVGVSTEVTLLISNLQDVDASTFGGVISSLGGLMDALGRAAVKAASLRAEISMGGAVIGGLTAGAGASASGTIDLQSPMAPHTSPRPNAAPNDIDFDIPDVSSGGGGSGGSGGVGGTADKFAARLETIITSLKTEQEVIDAWYAESLVTLQTATDAELSALGGKHEAIERLEDEHQKRLGSIKDMGNKMSLDAALGGAGEVLGALGAFNKKALKMQAVASAGQALISTWEGAAKELRKGTFGFSSAAAVVAKGLGFVAAIKSAGSGGGGSAGAGGAGGSGGAAPAPSPTTTFEFTFQNDPGGFGEKFGRQMAAQLNAAQRNGSRINAVVR